MTTTRTKWLRVSKRQPCPVCQRPNWCLVSPDGSAAICARTQSDRPVGRKGAGWLHALDGGSMPLPLTPPAKSEKGFPRAPIEHRHAAYSALLDLLPLTPGHLEHLMQRGLTQEEVTSLGYRSLPRDGRRGVVGELRERGFKLGGVPGFYLDSGEVRLSGVPGILLPVRDTQGRVLALQVRADVAGDGGKYRWVSSVGRHLGCSPGAPIHVSKRDGADTSDIWLTEGVIKGDLAALRLKRVVLAVAGVGNWHGILPLLRELQGKRVVVAFDMDKHTNPAVRLHLDALIGCLVRRGMQTFEADWRADAKGLDDLIGACHA